MGQQNRALFYGVDYTCYVEGGANDNNRSVDSSFWHEVFGHFKPDAKFAFLPRGGKPILEALAHKVINEDIANTVVALDADYDHLNGDRIDDDRVLYTYGYSWENDAYDILFMADIVGHIAHIASLPTNQRKAISDDCTAFADDIYRAIKIDYLALAAGSSMIPRDAPGRIVKVCPNSASPKIDSKEVLKLTRAANENTRPRALVPMPVISRDLRFLVGHCAAHAMGIVVRSALRRIGVRKSVSTDHVRDIAIHTLAKQLATYPASPVAAHHARQCAAIPVPGA